MPAVLAESQARLRPVAGEVRLMTTTPLELPAPSQVETLRERLDYQLARRPWLIPAALLGAGAVYLLLRRR